ncbi:MAG: ATP-binding cassette domain-containing protein [Treponema sp.]|jgi:zinc transport system ATP-binding protein|nr:ATP-binding cassette domain-containing protein [Treponema sp.]
MLIGCQNASFAYGSSVVVRNLNFSVDQGNYLCVVGENGSGKSTLIKGLLGLIRPCGGAVVTDPGLRAGDTGYLPQQTAVQKDFPASVYEVVLSGRIGARLFHPFYTRADRAAAEENLERLGIADLRRRSYRELSGGQQQRTLIARSLCAARKLIILDEPAAGLDPLIGAGLYDLLETINREKGIAVIMVSQDIDKTLDHAGLILHVKNDQLFFGSAEDYRHSAPGIRFLEGREKKND